MLNPLSRVQNLKDPLKMFVATFQITFKAGSPLAALVRTDNLELRCQTFTFPKLTGDLTEVEWGGFHRKYAGKQTRSGEWAVSFTEVWDSSITEAFKVWFNQYHNYKNGTISLLEAYTADVNVALVNPDVYDPQPDGIQRYDIRLFDVFPVSVDFPTIEASSSNPVEINCTLSYNYFLLGDEND